MDELATKLLFICSRNKIRSLTVEKLMEGVPGMKQNPQEHSLVPG